MYGFEDTTSSGISMGLNSGATITKFEYNALGGAGGAEQDCIDVTIKVKERDFRTRYYPVVKVYGKNNEGELTDKTSAEYKKQHALLVKDLNGMLTQVVKCFVPVEDLKAALATPINSFKDYAVLLERLIKTVPGWDTKPVDVFLQYQWKISEGQTTTFLEIPKKIGTHGEFLCASKGEGFVKNHTGSLKYVNAEGIEHPFKRSAWFMDSPFANRVQPVEENEDVDLGSGGSPTTTGWPGM